MSMYSFDLLEEITNGFSDDRLISEGGFGVNYKGVFEDGHVIAVMKLYPIREIDEKQFQQEFANLMKLRHQNIVRLLSNCYEKKQRLVHYNGKHIFTVKTHMAVCFEYLSNGSLDQYVSDASSGLDWPARYRIIKGMCEGIRYLHEGLESPILHMDLKPSNILLDENMEAKIGDFGLQTLFGEANGRPMGTTGYMPPEFIARQAISCKFDIYGIGVIIIELMTGGRRGCNDVYSHEFIELVRDKWRERLKKSVNGMSVERYCQQVTNCLEIALKCVEYDRHERPSIGDIVHKLNEMENLIPEEDRAVQNRFNPRKSLLLDVQPPKLCFPFMLNGRNKAIMSSISSLLLKNRANDRVAFMLVANIPKRYLTKMPLCGILPPRSAHTITVRMCKKPASISPDNGDFFTLYSFAVRQYDLLHVGKDSISVECNSFFKKAQETASARGELQVATLNVLYDGPAAESAGTSPEVTSLGIG